MCSIRKRSFICRITLLIIFLEYSFIDKSSSNRDVCLKGNRRNIQYIKAQQRDPTEVDWNAAWTLCSSQNLNLPVICNSKEQDAFANYLRLNITGSAWTSGKKITLQEWTWMNGQVFKSRENLTVLHESYVYVALSEDRSYKTGSHSSKIYYLCQYSGSLCNDNTYITMRNGCLHASDDDRTWYDARNRCLENGGDLAVLDDDADRNTLKNSNRLHPKHSYWIGLRKISWQWNTSASVAGEVKFSNWAKEPNSASGECISIDASTGEWKAVGCTDKKKVVCQRTLDETKSSSTPSTTPSKTLEKDSSAECASGTVSYASFISVLVVGVCLIVISNVVVGVLVRRHTKAQFLSSTETHQKVVYQDLQTTQGQMSSNIDSNYAQLQLQPEYEEVGRDGRSH